MTKPNLDEKRDAFAMNACMIPGKDGEPNADQWTYEKVVEGWNAALAALREVPVEFDSQAAKDEAIRMSNEDKYHNRITDLVQMARWQFSRDKERIALAEAQNERLRKMAELDEVKRLRARVAELTEAIVFSLRGLQMWRTYQSPGNIAEVEQRLRQALKRDGGSDE